jgi:hypothetical protein
VGKWVLAMDIGATSVAAAVQDGDLLAVMEMPDEAIFPPIVFLNSAAAV